jgi:hypothetical protein
MGNFLWFSDITLLLAFFAVLFESSLLASMAAIGGIIFESLWTLTLLTALVFNVQFELTNYMFDPSIPIWIRLISLFHIILPPLLIWLMIRLAYKRVAWPIQIGIIWIAIVLTWLFTDPNENINFVFGYQKIGWSPVPYLLLEAGVMAFILTATHLLILRIRKIEKI